MSVDRDDLFARAWAEAQTGLDDQTHAVLRVLAERATGGVCIIGEMTIAAATGVDRASVEGLVAALVNGGYLLVRDRGFALNVDVEMLRRHLRRNRLQIGSGAPPAAAALKPQPEPQPKRGKPPEAPQKPPTTVFVRQGSPEWDAWMRARGPRGAPVTYSPNDRAHGWWFPSLWPEQKEACRHAQVDK